MESVGDKDRDKRQCEHYATKHRSELLQVGVQYFFERELIPKLEVPSISLAELASPLIGYYWLFIA